MFGNLLRMSTSNPEHLRYSMTSVSAEKHVSSNSKKSLSLEVEGFCSTGFAMWPSEC